MTPPGKIADVSASKPDLVAEFGAAVFDSAIQRPINGLTQLGGKLVGHELPQLHIVDVPKAESIGQVFAQQAGAAVGMLVPFLGTRALVRGAAGSRLGTGYGSMALEGGTTGFLMGSVLTPVENGQPFWQTRLANGLTDGGTFAVLGVAAKGASSVKALGITAETPLLSRIGKGALAGSVSGLPAGFAHAELHSLTRGNGFASGAEVAGDMAGFALFGGLLGGVQGARAHSRFNPNADAAAGEKPAAVQTETPGAKGISVMKAGAEVQTTNAPVRNDLAPVPKPVLTEGTRVYTTEEMLRVVAAREAAVREAAARDSSAKPASEKILPVRKQSRLGEGDEGIVYSNGDGSVTKVFHEKGKSMEDVKAIYDKLNSIGIKTPKILEIGKTEDGLPALRMEQIGDGDPLRMQLLMREIQGADMVALRNQYYAYADALKEAGIRIDWQTKNMRFQDGQLYFLDPSFLKKEPMSDAIVSMFAGSIGPRQ
ncbi:MAG: hypothetical protein C0469_11890 [Cyanobacteria bacterium DS2.3.42]|nr:hypothetical protein [Cyanobacteria bacterium DS2.3.42]